MPTCRHYSVSLLLLAGWLLFALGTPARAQVADMQNLTASSAQLASTMALAHAIKVRGTTRPAMKATSAGAQRYTYVSSPALRQQTVRQLAARLQPSDPAAAKSLTDSFGPGKTDYGQLYKSILDDTPLPDNDAAAALAAYLLTGYLVVNNIRDSKAITPAMAQGVRTQVAALLAGSSALASPQAVGQVGEEMKLQTVILALGAQQSMKTNAFAAFQRSTRQLFSSQYGFDMTKVRPTSQGFIKQQ